MPVIGSKLGIWLKPADQMDAWLDSQGYYRKHIARDASSLFRCVSEQVFFTQVYHLTIRKQCIQFAINHPEVFKKLTDIPVREYVDRLNNVKEWGNSLDMEIMSLIYSLEFVVFKEIKCPEEHITMNGYTPRIVLSLSYDHHYDSVYPKEHILNAAVCQSIFYEILYKEVFKLEEVDYAVNKMLHDKNARYQPELNIALCTTGFQMRLEMRDACRNVKQLLNCGITPFPYKVAKSLDPNIYRNVEYDSWNEQRKGLRHGTNHWNDRELQIGTRCVANFNENGTIVKRHGYIQEMAPNNGPVLMFVEELGEKLTIPFENLEILPTNLNSKEMKPDLNDSRLMNDDSDYEDESNIDENIQNLKKEIGDEIYHISRQVPSISDMCYTHPSSTSVPSSYYSCITTRMNQSENETKLATPMIHNSSTDNSVEVKENCTLNEIITSSRSSTVSTPHSVAVYPVVSQEMNVQTSSIPGNMYSKSSSSECTDVNSTVRLICNNSIEPYHRYSYPLYPYYSCVIYPVNTDLAAQSNTDVPELNYPSAYPTVLKQNDSVYGITLNNAISKADTVCSSQNAKRSIRYLQDTQEYSHAEPVYRTKDLLYVRETVPTNAHFRQNGPNLYPITYPLMPQYYFYGSCPEVPPSYENMTDAHPLPPMTSTTHPEVMYQANGQIFLQTLISNPGH